MRHVMHYTWMGMLRMTAYKILGWSIGPAVEFRTVLWGVVYMIG